jgi:UV DNA damage endonuclease
VETLKEHFILSRYLGIREINIHIGGKYDSKEKTKKRFVENMRRYFSREELNYITIENDELNYSIKDVLEVAQELQIRVTYDIHHERCFQIGKEIDEEQLFLEVQKTWKDFTYQRVHLSSPRYGYSTSYKSRPHSDYIDKDDFPKWIKKYKNVHIDIEAKAKELAVKDICNFF